MGKISILTKEQKAILDDLSNHQFFLETFYFTGGTALSEFYLQHRYSEDLDFFTEERFDNQIILGMMDDLSKKHNFRIKSRFAEVVYRFDLDYPETGASFKIDFGYYPYKRIEESGKLYNRISVDSLRDIATNKLFTINQRTDVKDFVDLYFLLKDFTLWDLLYGLEAKFGMEIDKIIVAQDMLKIEDFTLLPKMLKPLSLDRLKRFFRETAKELAKKVVV